MKSIFISYRRIDSYETNRLSTSLKTEYGESNIFLDYESISGGDEWPEKIRKAVEEASVLLIIIGKNWLFMQDDESGKRKIDMTTDWVRKEIITFLNRYKENKELLVIPILINGAKMPNKEFLDSEISALCDFQAIELPNTMSSVDFVQIKNRLVKAKVYSTIPLPVVTPVGEIPPDSLTQEQEEEFLDKNRLWKIKEHEKTGSIGETMRELYRVFEFKSYDDAWKFMSLIDAKGIKPHNHHPRWQNTYNRVEVWLCTFNIGHQPSKRDLRLANIMEDTWEEFAMGQH
ncbi:MAG: 4a-hydroxytetrahydrobiopterin dehydratase [Chitinophagales bacterium]